VAEDTTPARTRLINLRAQPVELHLGRDVCALGAGESIEIDAGALALPQLAYLVARRAIAVRPVAPPVRAEKAAPTPRKPGKSTRAAARSPQPSRRKKRP